MVFTRRKLCLHRPTRGRAHNGDRLAPLLKFQEHICHGDIALITHIAD